MTLTRQRGVLSRPRFLTALTLPTVNLFARFIAGVGETVSGGKTTVWADQSGNGWDATPVGANAPYHAVDYLGRPVVRLYGSESTSLGFAAAHSFNARNLSVFMVLRNTYPSGNVVFGLLNYATGREHMGWSSSPNTFSVTNRDTTIKAHTNPMMMGVVSGAAAVAGYSQYQSTTGLAVATADTDCAGATIGQFAGSAVSNIELYEAVVYEGAVDVAAVTAYLQNKYKLRSTDYRKNVVCEGDSITQGFGQANAVSQPYPLQVLRRGIEDWRTVNVGVSGSTVANMVSRGTAVDARYEAGFTRNVLMVLIGRNDAQTLTAQQIFDALVPYVQARVTAGWEVWVGTCIGTTNTTWQAILTAYNAKLRGTDGPGIIVAAGATRVVDFAAISQLADSTAAANATYYQDGTHPTPVGAALMANLVAPLLGAY